MLLGKFASHSSLVCQLVVTPLLCAQIGEEDNPSIRTLIDYFDKIKYAGKLTLKSRLTSMFAAVVHLLCDVSLLGPILFILYTADLVALIAQFGLSSHLYADDTQIFGACSPADVDVFLLNVNVCLNAVADWMHSNRLQLNNDKTEFLWCTYCTTSRRQHRLPAEGPTVGCSHIKPSSSAVQLTTWESSSTRTCR